MLKRVSSCYLSQQGSPDELQRPGLGQQRPGRYHPGAEAYLRNPGATDDDPGAVPPLYRLSTGGLLCDQLRRLSAVLRGTLAGAGAGHREPVDRGARVEQVQQGSQGTGGLSGGVRGAGGAVLSAGLQSEW